jgi:hypothetical protein
MFIINSLWLHVDEIAAKFSAGPRGLRVDMNRKLLGDRTSRRRFEKATASQARHRDESMAFHLLRDGVSTVHLIQITGQFAGSRFYQVIFVGDDNIPFETAHAPYRLPENPTHNWKIKRSVATSYLCLDPLSN